MSKNKIDRIVVSATKYSGIILLAGIIIWAGKYCWEGRKYEQTNDAQIDAYLSPVNVKIGGYIKKIYYADNQRVHKGDTLVWIEPDEYRLKKEAADGELMSARAKLVILDANEETQRKNIGVIRARLSGVQAKLEQQQREFERYEKMLKEAATTQQKFENVKAALIINQSGLDEAKATLSAAESKLDDLVAERTAINAEIRIREAMLARQELDVQYTIVTAPFDGQLGRKTIQEGQLVQPGQTLVFLTNESEEKWVVANFKETQIGAFHIGQRAKVEVDAFPGESFDGIIESKSPTTGSRYSLLPPDNATGNFVKVIQRIPVRIKLSDTKEKLAKLSAGMNANVYIIK
jgi:membrane fusion protein (multidrug efflux system)